ncbi:CPBP family intramembrane glutamic endopeptidase [Paenibacillus motobuensis]|uniref:CPBP family intramembrane metalloprotease n=1 Tax=Paenibacillus motobuensis TaxID=295324 RepID=A0ABP3I860_9BACL
MTKNILISSMAQVILIIILALVCWLIFGKKRQPFLSWIGVIKPEVSRKRLFIGLFLSGFILFSAVGWLVFVYFTSPSDVAASQFYGVGISGIGAALLYSFVQTGLSEEILFRGLIGKRCIAVFGFGVGNSIQSVLFGCLHGLMFLALAGAANAVIITIFTALIGWVMGYMNEKLSGGSILPSWLLHGLANLFSTLIMMFQLF